MIDAEIEKKLSNGHSVYKKIHIKIGIVTGLILLLGFLFQGAFLIFSLDSRAFGTTESRVLTEKHVKEATSEAVTEKIKLHVDNEGKYLHLTVSEREEIAVVKQDIKVIKEDLKSAKADRGTMKTLLYSINSKLPN